MLVVVSTHYESASTFCNKLLLVLRQLGLITSKLGFIAQSSVALRMLVYSYCTFCKHEAAVGPRAFAAYGTGIVSHT